MSTAPPGFLQGHLAHLLLSSCPTSSLPPAPSSPTAAASCNEQFGGFSLHLQPLPELSCPWKLSLKHCFLNVLGFLITSLKSLISHLLREAPPTHVPLFKSSKPLPWHSQMPLLFSTFSFLPCPSIQDNLVSYYVFVYCCLSLLKGELQRAGIFVTFMLWL